MKERERGREKMRGRASRYVGGTWAFLCCVTTAESLPTVYRMLYTHTHTHTEPVWFKETVLILSVCICMCVCVFVYNVLAVCLGHEQLLSH